MTFDAAPHPLLVRSDGHGFDARTASASPDTKELKTTKYENNLEKESDAIGRWQHKLYACKRYAVLLVFQALDAAGKDSTIRHVFRGVNPTGLHVTSFGRPTALELSHDFLWRTTMHLPPRGHISIFNRSYYEEVLVVRVHPELLEAQRLPKPPHADFWQRRYEAILAHERHLAEEGTVILKFWLNVSKDEQRRRFLARIERPNKRWKFSLQDVEEREHWDRYLEAYDQCLKATSRPWAPWYAIPADDKPYMRWQVATLISTALAGLNVDFPPLDPAASAGLETAKKKLGAA
jgi:PPK2 family polyphosphate:nucleotide phosphotransferase